jgi:hypothetical protein
MLQLDWFYQTPLDFEHKNYLLLQYLKKVDDSYSEHHLSPYLLWTEKLLSELKTFEHNSNILESKIRRDIISIDLGKIKIIKEEVKKTDEIKIVFEIVEYSTPLLQSKIKLGYKLLDKYPQILY